jgi:toxin-antitoxin system PIN domain toxin
MRALLDVNVLIALFDEDHAHHQVAWDWLNSAIDDGWASCPITQNGCVRIMSQQGYPNPLPTAEVAQRLAEAVYTPHHEFWPDNVSLFDRHLIDYTRLLRPRQVTDTYLLALAVANGGRFVTFDHGIPVESVFGVSNEHLIVL